MGVFIVFIGILFGLISSTFGGVQSRAYDTERQTDIKALHGQVEAYYAQDGRYPTLVNLNDETWRSQNMRGLDDEALKDPQGDSFRLTAAPVKGSYSYSVKAADGQYCDNVIRDCTSYELTAELEDGDMFTKRNLN